MTAFGQRECWCGKSYAPTPDGRWNHAHIFGHVPTPAREQTTDRAWDAASTRAFAQVKRYDGGKKTAPEDACDVNEGLTRTTGLESNAAGAQRTASRPPEGGER